MAKTVTHAQFLKAVIERRELKLADIANADGCPVRPASVYSFLAGKTTQSRHDLIHWLYEQLGFDSVPIKPTLREAR